MKYGQTLLQQTEGFHDHNIPYKSIKHTIKVHTTPSPSPDLENLVLTDLTSALSHISDFLTLKHHEYTARVASACKAYDKLRSASSKTSARSSPASTPIATPNTTKLGLFYEKLLTLHYSLTALAQFKESNQVAVRKLLKKYRRWTSPDLAASLESQLDLDTPFRHEFKSLISKVDRILQLVSSRLGGAASAASSTRSASRCKRQNLKRTDSGVNVGPLYLGGERGWNEFDNSSEDGNETGDDGKFYVYSYGTEAASDDRQGNWRRWLPHGPREVEGDEETALLHQYGKDDTLDTCYSRPIPTFVHFLAPIASLLVLILLSVTPLIDLARDESRVSGDWVDLVIAVGVTISIICSSVGAWTVLWGGKGMGWLTRGALAGLVITGWIGAGGLVGSVVSG